MEKKFKLHKNVTWEFLLKNFVITLLIHLLIYAAFVYIRGAYYSSVWILTAVLVGWFLFYVLPGLVLYLNHLKRSKQVSLEVNHDKFTYKNKLKSAEFKLDEITKIEIFLTPPSYDARIDFLYLSHFFYCKIHTEKGIEVELSSLILKNIEDVFPSNLIERRKKIFPLMR